MFRKKYYTEFSVLKKEATTDQKSKIVEAVQARTFMSKKEAIIEMIVTEAVRSTTPHCENFIFYVTQILREIDFEIFNNFIVFWPKNLKNGQKISKFSLTVFIHFPTNILKQLWK